MTKSEFILLRRSEFPKTLKLLRLYPEDKKDLKPSPTIRSAIELATVFVNEEGMNHSFASTRAFDFTKRVRAEPLPTMREAIDELEAVAAETNAALARLSEDDFQQPVNAFGHTMPLSAVLFTMMLDHIHHRGQFTIYSRIAGAKVPQIYGPSADEPMQPPK